jgi:hypothetical protein
MAANMADDVIKLDLEPLQGAFTNGRGGPHVDVQEVTGLDDFDAYIFQAPTIIEDNDGIPTAYAPPGSNLPHLEPLSNAMRPPSALFHSNNFTWVGVYSMTPADAQANQVTIDQRPALCDKEGKYPVIQGSGAPAPGYYVSQSGGAAHPSLKGWNQRRYLDASTVQYGALGDALKGFGVSLGDVGLAIRTSNGANAAFYYADSGPETSVGECSRKVARTLFPDGSFSDDVSFLVFPGSGRGTSGLQTALAIGHKVKKEITKLSKASNTDILGAYFSSNSDLQGLRQRFRTDPSKVYNYRATEFRNIMNTLRKWGYQPTMGSFPLPAAGQA